MGKKNKSSKATSNKSTAECSCEHPYTCTCGNRPPRPSKGHKWDPTTKAWGGKGHKQKGASGQTASVAKEAVTTNVGKTKLEQWQRLPTRLLEEVCKREGRPRPKYKCLNDKYLYRVIIQDAKASKRGTDHDVILVPNKSCPNEEQAKEEAALLGLLHLSPSLPHERKLPEPYKTTWLHAVSASKPSASTTDKKQASNNNSTAQNKKPASNSSSLGATASINLRSAKGYASVAERRLQQMEKNKARKERIRKHEAIRMANRDHQVFLSANCRKQIEALLRGDSNLADLLIHAQDTDLSPEEEEEEEDDLKAYVMERLTHEGFTIAQSRTAYSQVVKAKNASADQDEEEWDRIHDECLQWLCIHLSEDDLPEGFDPRGGTLDIVAAPSKKEQKGKPTKEVQSCSAMYGLTSAEAMRVLDRAQTSSLEQAVYSTFVDAANASSLLADEAATEHQEEEEENLEVMREEIEALEAIFPLEECKITRDKSGSTNVAIQLPSIADDDSKMTLSIVVTNGKYPAFYPESILLTNGWTGKLNGLGAALHVELLQFVLTLARGDPMVYEIYGKAQELLHMAINDEIEPFSLFSDDTKTPVPKENEKSKVETKVVENKAAQPKRIPKKFGESTYRRPRPRSFFWSKTPRETPVATAFPKLSASLDRARKSLPAARARDEFLAALKLAEKNGRVVLVTGATGSGKTTQVPQYILEENPKEAKIVVAQPRRLAATGVALRVANERGEARAGIGSVGHVVRGDSAMCDSTRLMFCTTGVLLRQLQCSKALDCVSHVIVDEVHERHLDTDILLGILKACLDRTPHLKLILMSATIDEDRFARYFGDNIPRMHIEGRTFPVNDFTVEDVLQVTNYVPSKNGKKKRSGGYNRSRPWEYDNDGDDPTRIRDKDIINTDADDRDLPNIPSLEERIKRLDETNTDYDLVGQLVKHLIRTKKCGDGSILVFLPGAPEINAATKTLQRILRGLSVRLLPLHGGLQPKEQNLVFQSVERGCTKVILSTNIAETSITIQDCTIVIDSCREKQLSYDPNNRMPLLVEAFASKASLKQRRGRAGRVREGTCYKLISRATLSKLQEHGEPEIKRCALDQTLLSLLFLRLEDGTGKFLHTLLDPPSRKSIDAALYNLERLGAVEKEIDGPGVCLTPLGTHLAGIPAPPTVGKICVVGCILGCRQAALAIAAGMSLGRNPFLRVNSFAGYKQDNDEDSSEAMKQKNVLKERKQLQNNVGRSDHALVAAAYMEWEKRGTGGGERKQYCDRLGLSFNGMKDMKQLVSQLDSSLISIGFYGNDQDGTCSWSVVRACVVAALAPSQLVKVVRPSQKYRETVEGAVEREGNAKEIKLFIRVVSDEKSDSNGSPSDKAPESSTGTEDRLSSEQRVFTHPSSANFDAGSYDCPWLVYHELVKTSKAFLRDSTECSSYALLLFGGQLEVQAAKGVIVIDKWARLAANPRIGALIGGLRQKVDELLSRKVENPAFDISATAEMKIIVNLLVSDGLGL